MPIRAQCDNCGKVYNLPDESAGKRLRCKQCAAAFMVPALRASVAPAHAPTVATPAAPQKICVVCGQDVAGRPRTKDPQGNYYCRACYEEKAREKEQLAQSRVGAAVPAGVGAGGGGGDDGEMIDLAALEPTEQEQFDESAQPPPPPIPDLDYVSAPLPDMSEEPVMAEPVMEAPKPKKKKKKKAAAAVDKTAAANTIISKIIGLPFEVWVLAIAAIFGIGAMISSDLAPRAVMVFICMGVLAWLWGHICIVLAAFQEDTGTGIMVLLLPFYELFFVISNWDVVKRHVGRLGLSVIFFIAAIGISAKVVKEEIGNFRDEMARYEARNLTSEPNFKMRVNLDESPDESEKALAAREQEIADAVMAILKERGVKPPEGVKYVVDASAMPGDNENEIVCQLEINDSTGALIFRQEKGFMLPGEAPTGDAPDADAQKRTRKKKSANALEKELWKNAVPVFKELAGQVPGTAPTTAPTTAPAAAAEPSSEEIMPIGVKFHSMLPDGRAVDYFFGDPKDISKRKEDIEDVIWTSLEQRGIKPPEGQMYRIEAVVEENWSPVQKVKLASGEEGTAPILICKMRVKDSVGRGNYIFSEVKNIELPADLVARASRSKLSTFHHVPFIEEALWKEVPRTFKALVDQFKPQPTAAPSGANVPEKAVAPTETAAPAK